MWPRSAILEKAAALAVNNSDAKALLDAVADDWDEGILLATYFVLRHVFTTCYLLLLLSAVTHAPFHASMLRPASQVGPMHESAGEAS